MSNNPEIPLEDTGSGDGSAASRPWWLGAAVIALGCVCLYGAAQLPQGARYAAIGPGMFVTVAGGGLVFLGIALLVQIARGEKFEPQDAEDASGDEKANPVALATALAAAIVPIRCPPRGFQGYLTSPASFRMPLIRVVSSAMNLPNSSPPL